MAKLETAVPKAVKKKDAFKRALAAAGLSVLSITKVSGAPYRLYRLVDSSMTPHMVLRNPDDSWIAFGKSGSGTIDDVANIGGTHSGLPAATADKKANSGK